MEYEFGGEDWVDGMAPDGEGGEPVGPEGRRGIDAKDLAGVASSAGDFKVGGGKFWCAAHLA